MFARERPVFGREQERDLVALRVGVPDLETGPHQMPGGADHGVPESLVERLFEIQIAREAVKPAAVQPRDQVRAPRSAAVMTRLGLAHPRLDCPNSVYHALQFHDLVRPEPFRLAVFAGKPGRIADAARLPHAVVIGFVGVP